VDHEPGFQFEDAGGEFDQAQPQRCGTAERLGMMRRIDHTLEIATFSFRANGITALLKHHALTRTTQLFDRRRDEV
jgi:hypothetical protein